MPVMKYVSGGNYHLSALDLPTSNDRLIFLFAFLIRFHFLAGRVASHDSRYLHFAGVSVAVPERKCTANARR